MNSTTIVQEKSRLCGYNFRLKGFGGYNEWHTKKPLWTFKMFILRRIAGIKNRTYLIAAMSLVLILYEPSAAQDRRWRTEEEYSKPGEQQTADFLSDQEYAEEKSVPQTSVLKRQFRGYGKYRLSFAALCKALASDGRAVRFAEILEHESQSDSECIACRPLFRAFVAACGPKVKTKKVPTRAATAASHGANSEPGEEDTNETLEKDAVEIEPGKEVVTDESESGESEAESPVDNSPVEKVGESRLAKSAAREPHAYVIDIASRFGFELSEDQAIREETVIAFQKMRRIVMQYTKDSPGGTEYFDTFLHFFEASLLDSRPNEEQNPGGHSEEKRGVSEEEKQELLGDMFKY